MLKKILNLIFFFCYTLVFAQETVIIPKFLFNPMDSITKQSFNKSLESFFFELTKGKVNENLLTPKRKKLTSSQLQKLVDYEIRKDSLALKYKDKKLINIYPLSDKNKYFISISYNYQKPNSETILLYIVNLIATKDNDKFTFSIPLDYLTRYWKTQTFGNITYHFRNFINTDRAKIFNKKNSEIANKLGVLPEKFDFYMTENFQEISKLLGYGYSLFSNGKYRDGYGVDSKTIFAIMNNEDFSHDIFHYYSGKINKRSNRNWITEEGIAYLWGNAYYTDKKGEMITHKRLVVELKKYLSKNPSISLYKLFKSNKKIFTNIAPESSVRSTISGIIAKEIEIKKGNKAILKLINAGRKNKLENYLKTINQLIGINKENFNVRVKKLIEKY
ncbi:hypothetical protein MHM83_09265 [Tenacibaculum sp. Mcav3-52]|uniref:hypothetical protein n=1 Tax=unclassified Tenacibaculum TaxID=2635139 RepID=UPI0012E6B1DF|nr:hypothetical protein [Tenacibaculum sp. Mcav3-52]MCG7502058.1 hypothetical protein [Tenacibaculum sp. Mcav3-52]GFD83005.1 hypothetical protein KUL118_58670 [Tenacibaculum sp. KUL118]